MKVRNKKDAHHLDNERQKHKPMNKREESLMHQNIAEVTELSQEEKYEKICFEKNRRCYRVAFLIGSKKNRRSPPKQ